MSEKFGSKTSFIMASVGSAVGLGNIFRFPSLAVKYGIIFVLMYIFLLLLTGVPMLMSEIALGRRYGGSAVKSIGRANPAFLPVGWLSAANSFIIMTYYCLLFSYVLLTAFFSFRLLGETPDRSADLFTDIIYPKGFPTAGLIFLLIGWAIVMLCYLDAERLGKISTVGVIFASAVIGIMAVAGGISNPSGVIDFLRFAPQHTFSVDFWLDCLAQVFFSLSVMVGVMPVYGACLDKKENILSSALAVAFFDLLVSLASTLIYIGADAKGSQGLFACFSVYPKAFSRLGPGIGMAVAALFYLSVAVLCLDSVFAYLKSVATAVSEKIWLAEQKTARILSIIAAVFGLSLLGRGGGRTLEYIDGEIVPLLTLIIGIFEAVFFAGLVDKGLLSEINLNAKNLLPRRIFRFSVAFLSPAVMIILIIAQIFF